ncbi:TPA: hypothetical protein NI776_001825 [Pseudomonas aeruginosa]|nr:hypothetical protein [Pseudomonas aeruginosa]
MKILTSALIVFGTAVAFALAASFVVNTPSTRAMAFMAGALVGIGLVAIDHNHTVGSAASEAADSPRERLLPGLLRSLKVIFVGTKS